LEQGFRTDPDDYHSNRDEISGKNLKQLFELLRVSLLFKIGTPIVAASHRSTIGREQKLFLLGETVPRRIATPEPDDQTAWVVS